MIRLILLLTFILGINNLNCQTYIKPIIGYGFSKNQSPNTGLYEPDLVNGDAISDESFTNGSLLLGLSIEQKITPKISVVSSFAYVHQKQVMTHNFAGVFTTIYNSTTRFRRINIELVPAYEIFPRLKLGLGGKYSRIHSFELRKAFGNNPYEFKDVRFDGNGNSHLFGWSSSLSYSIYDFEIEINYSFVDEINKPIKIYIENSSFIQITLGYKFGFNSARDSKV